jgi:deazaflavin-dependent oxidoreductase (nitroreductase family)
MSAASRKEHPNNAPGVPMVYPVAMENFQVKYVNPPYRTVVTAFRKGNTIAISLGHGKTDWVKNVLAAGEADLHFIRKDVHLINPRIVPAGSGAAGLPFAVRVQANRMAIFVADIA